MTYKIGEKYVDTTNGEVRILKEIHHCVINNYDSTCRNCNDPIQIRFADSWTDYCSSKTRFIPIAEFKFPHSTHSINVCNFKHDNGALIKCHLKHIPHSVNGELEVCDEDNCIFMKILNRKL